MIDHTPTYSAFRTPLALPGLEFYDHHLVGLTWPYINCKGKQYHVTMLDQDWWQTTWVTEILEERTEEDGTEYVRFKTGNSEYEWKSF